MKLGKKRAIRDDRTLKATDYAGRCEVPLECDWDRGVKRWPMHRNDTMGTCGVASFAHLVQCQSTAADGAKHAQKISTREVVKAYLELSPDDEGVVMLDALKYFRSEGVGGVRIGAFAEVPLWDVSALFTAIYLFGGVYAGFMLPRAVESMDTTWVAPASPDQLTGEWEYGSLGGHAVYLGGHDSLAGTVRGATWGRKLEISLAFLAAYMDECYVTVGESWTDDLGVTPGGHNLQKLVKDARRLAG